MKKAMFRISTMFALACSGLFITSCGDDDPIIIDDDGPMMEDANLTGELNEDRTLDPTIEYSITGTYRVKSGATLTIPAGTLIVAEKGNENAIAIEQGADIMVEGTEANPVIMTSADEDPGDWGGLLIAGEATTTAGVNATAEVLSLEYGGNDDADNSGSISYLVINYAGAQTNAEVQFNGLSLYSVGSGTSINNVAMLNGTDDGIEFFGGTVSVTNIYLENNQDDAVDWTEGWNGTVTNTYVLHSNGNFSTAIEGDGVNNNPTLENFTAESTTGGTAFQFKKGSGVTINGLSLAGYDTTIDFADPDQGSLDNIIINGAVADTSINYTAPRTVDPESFAWTNNTGGISAEILQGSITEDVTLDPSVAYRLNSSYSVEEGATLTIPAGTKITARTGNNSNAASAIYIVVQKGGQIDIQGTPENPVVMSSETAEPGDWGGLVILGQASTTAGVDAIAEIGGFIYGGNADEDSSGSISNLVIVGTGAQINAESQYNGVSMYAVGSGTTIENVAVINGADDGVEFFGGTVSASNIYLENNQDDAVDWTEGWNGTVTNTYVSHTNANFSTAIEADGLNNNPQLVNFTAITTMGAERIAMQFKAQSGATITNLYLEGYDTNVDLPDNAPLSGIIINGAAAVLDADYNTGTQVDISTWTWKDARL